MKLLKRIVAICIMITTVCSSTVVYAAECEQEIVVEDVELREAEHVAITHIHSIMATDENSSWKDGVRISSRRALFGADEEISAYYFGLVDQDDEPCGYVITGADTGTYPLLEYAEEGESFINVTIDATSEKAESDYDKNIKRNGSKVYYLGGMSYAVEHTFEDYTKVMYDTTSAQVSKIDKKTVNKAKNKDNYEELWHSYEKISENSAGKSSNPPNKKGDGFITYPVQYESGYIYASDPFLVTSGGRNYSVMEDFSDGGVCGPTAGVNMCKYWYYRDRDKYNALCINKSWKDSFWAMYDYMKTDKKNGTHWINLANAYMLYFDDCGLVCKSYTNYTTNNGRYIVDELNNDRPCHLSLRGHYVYGNHEVLAIGYREFVYQKWYGKSYSTYIRIADGWTESPSRYVWGGCSGDWAYTVVIPE